MNTLSHILQSNHSEWFGVFQDENALSRFQRGRVSLVRSPADWANVDFDHSILAMTNTFQGVSDLSFLSEKRFCIFIDNFEDLLLKEELLYFILSHHCPVFVKCRSMESIQYFKTLIQFDPIEVFGEKLMAFHKILIRDKKLLIRKFNWNKRLMNRNQLFIDKENIRQFFKLNKMTNVSGFYFAPEIKMNQKIILKALSLKQWNCEPIEIYGNFKENQGDSLINSLKNYFIDLFIQWHCGTKLIV